MLLGDFEDFRGHVLSPFSRQCTVVDIVDCRVYAGGVGLTGPTPRAERHTHVNGPVDLTDLEWDVMDAIRDRLTTTQICALLNISAQTVGNYRRRLIEKGVIVRDGDLPWWLSHSERYPFRVDGNVDVRWKAVVPPGVVLRALWPTDSRDDLSVTPIRVARWPEDNRGVGGWVVQGLPTVDPQGRHPSNVVPVHRVVWCLGDCGEDVSFSVPLKHPWAQSHTVAAFQAQRMELDGPVMEGLTLMIAAVCGLRDTVLDLTGITSKEGK